MTIQKPDKELELTEQYDYKLQIEKLTLRLYLHTAMMIGLVLAIVGLIAYYPVIRAIYLALAVFGAFVTITAWYLLSRINKVR